MSDESYYEIGAPLGEGGFGSVYRATHRPTGLPVAVKLLRRADPESLRMLLAEASALAKVRHQNVAQLLDVGRTPEGVGFLVMELVRGHDLERWLDAWPGWSAFARALLEMLDGLSAAHAAGVVHRDLKPPNLLLDERDGALRIVDFGVATVLDPLEDPSQEIIAGTPEFMAPEQLGGLRTLGPATDLYAFGVLLHHVVYGRSPFDDALPLPLLLEAKQTRVATGSRAPRPGLEVPEGLHSLIDALMAPDVRARPRFAATVRAELGALADRVIDRVDGAVPPSRPMPSRSTAASTLVRGSSELPSRASVPAASAPRSGFPATRVTQPSEPGPRASLDGLGRIPAVTDPRRGSSLIRLREPSLVGREEERAALTAKIHEVRATGDVRLMVLLGEPGIGKSRLARWGLAEVERCGWMQSSAVAYELDGIGVGGGVGHLLGRLVGADRDASAYEWLRARDPAIEPGRLHALLMPSGATLPSRAQVVDLAKRVLRAAARDAPLYLWLDDIGWAHDGITEVVESLVAEGGAPILLVATMRASTAEHTAVRRRLAASLTSPRTSVLHLAPLTLAARRALVEELAPLEKAIADEMAATVDGSPLLLVQLVHDWLEAGLLVPSPHGLTLPRGRTFAAALAERPPTRAMDARIDRLLESFLPRSEAAESVLLRAALLGAAFDEGTLLSSTEDPAVRDLAASVLDRAVLAGLLRAEDGSLGFEHGLAQENLLSRLEARADKRAILFDTANGLQATFGKDRSDVAFAVGQLLRRAGRIDAAWDRLLHAVDRAAWNGDIASAMAYLETASSWASADAAAGRPSRRLLVALATGRTHYMASRYPEARACLEEARGLAAAEGDVALLARCDAILADVAFFEDRYAESETLAAQALSAMRDVEDPDAAVVAGMAAHRLGEIAYLRGDLDAAYGFAQERSDHARRSGLTSRERLASLGMAEMLLCLGRLPEARAELVEARHAAEAAADSDHLHTAIEVGAFVDLLDGRARPAREHLEVRLRQVEALGEPWRITGLKVGLALAALLDETPERAREAVLDMLAAFDVVPNDSPRERVTMERVIALCARRAMPDLAAACAVRMEARAEKFRAALRA